MYSRLAVFVAALVLAATTAAFAQSPVDATGRVVRVDPAGRAGATGVFGPVPSNR